MNLVTGLAIPFLGTTLGSAMVFLMKNKMNSKVEKLLLEKWLNLFFYSFKD